jgi:precorrin-3B methylase
MGACVVCACHNAKIVVTGVTPRHVIALKARSSLIVAAPTRCVRTRALCVCVLTVRQEVFDSDVAAEAAHVSDILANARDGEDVSLLSVGADVFSHCDTCRCRL